MTEKHEQGEQVVERILSLPSFLNRVWSFTGFRNANWDNNALIVAEYTRRILDCQEQVNWCMCQDLGGISFVNKVDQSESARLIPTRVIVENWVKKLFLMIMVKK